MRQIETESIPEEHMDNSAPSNPSGARRSGTALLRATLAGIAVAGVIAGCGSGSSGGSSAATPSTSGGTPKNIPSNLSVGFAAKIGTLNPYTVADSAGVAAIHLIAGNLLESRGATGTTVPGLATSAVVSHGGLTWNITLRPNLKFSDGTPLTSADVKATLDYARTDKANGQAFAFSPIVGVDAPSPTSVVLHLSRPYPSLHTLLGYFDFAIFPAHSIAAKTFFDKPVSAGPYEVQSWGGGNTAVFVRNPNYSGPKPLIQQITFEVVPDPNTALAEIKSGQLDMMYSLPPNLIPQITSPAILSVVPLHGSDTMTAVDTSVPFSDIRVRRAIGAALDRSQIVATTWDNRVKPLAGFWPSTMEGYDPSISTQQNLSAAKADLNGTACASGCNATLMYSTAAYPQQGTEAVAIAAELAKIGIHVSLQNVDATTVFTNLAGAKFQLALSVNYDLGDVPDNVMAYGLLPPFNADWSKAVIPGITKLWTNVAVSTGAAHQQALAAADRAFNQFVPWWSLSDYADVVAQRVPTSVAQVQATTNIAVIREGGGVQ